VAGIFTPATRRQVSAMTDPTGYGAFNLHGCGTDGLIGRARGFWARALKKKRQFRYF